LVGRTWAGGLSVASHAWSQRGTHVVTAQPYVVDNI
jgi:hypothetical protein